MSPHTSLTPEVMPPPTPKPHLPLNSQTQTPHMGTSPQNHAANPAIFTEKQIQDHHPNKQRPLLLEEQPLLLQDLLDQERQEQQQQKQMQALMRQRPPPESGTSMGKTCRRSTASHMVLQRLHVCVCVCVCV